MLKQRFRNISKIRKGLEKNGLIFRVSIKIKLTMPIIYKILLRKWRTKFRPWKKRELIFNSLHILRSNRCCKIKNARNAPWDYVPILLWMSLANVNLLNDQKEMPITNWMNIKSSSMQQSTTMAILLSRIGRRDLLIKISMHKDKIDRTMSLWVGAGRNSMIKEIMRTNQVIPKYSKPVLLESTNFVLKGVSIFRIQLRKAIQVISKAPLHLLSLTIDFKSRKNLKKGEQDIKAVKREIAPIRMDWPRIKGIVKKNNIWKLIWIPH